MFALLSALMLALLVGTFAACSNDDDDDDNDTTTADTLFAGYTYKLTKIVINGQDYSNQIGSAGYYMEIVVNADGRTVHITEKGIRTSASGTLEYDATYTVDTTEKTITGVANGGRMVFSYSDDNKTLTRTEDGAVLTYTRQ